VNALNGYEFGGLNTSGTVTFSQNITPANVGVSITGTAGGLGGTNPVTTVHNIALSAVAGGTADFTGVISGATAPTLGSTTTPGAVGQANNTRITINQFRNHPNLDANVDGVPDASNANQNGANQLVGTPTSGTVVLSGINTYGGTTEVLGGKLIVNGSIAGNTVTVASGATLGGVGIIEVGLASSTLEINGILSPGNSAGVLTSNKDVRLNAGAAFNVELNGSVPGTEYDRLAVGDAATVFLAATSTVQLALNHTPTPGTAYTIIDNLGADAINGVFANLADDAVVTLNYAGTNYDFVSDYQGGTGNDLVLTGVIPEPSATVLAFAVLGLTLRRRRR
jgi:fibronectin-binding autotransporter adhesin